MATKDHGPAAAEHRDPHGRRGTAVQLAALLLFLAGSALVALLGSQATITNVDGWYASASKAPWSPPNWVFGPVWTLLYTAMAVAAWLVWRSQATPARSAGTQTPATRTALTVYGVQLALNLAWTPVFFGLYPALGTAALWLALAIILALALAVAATVLCFGPISRAAGLLMLPYLSWVVFAASLNLWAAVNN
jgi:tryptophan-rich sensory protein